MKKEEMLAVEKRVVNQAYEKAFGVKNFSRLPEATRIKITSKLTPREMIRANTRFHGEFIRAFCTGETDDRPSACQCVCPLRRAMSKCVRGNVGFWCEADTKPPTAEPEQNILKDKTEKIIRDYKAGKTPEELSRMTEEEIRDCALRSYDLQQDMDQFFTDCPDIADLIFGQGKVKKLELLREPLPTRRKQ